MHAVIVHHQVHVQFAAFIKTMETKRWCRPSLRWAWTSAVHDARDFTVALTGFLLLQPGRHRRE